VSPRAATGLEAGFRRTSAHQLAYVDRIAQPFDVDRADRLDFYVALRQPQGVSRHQNRTHGGHLFHACCEMGRLADGGVVHMEIAPDRPDDDFARIQAHPNLREDAFPESDLF
jgi:hypothetical protein